MRSDIEAGHAVVQGYYDSQITRRLNDYVEGNERVEKAWATVLEWAPDPPRRILEIGCGIGDTSFRMAEQWQDAEVVGIDISARAIEVGRRLFQSPRIMLDCRDLSREPVEGSFDLIVMLDVYEHIGLSARPHLHRTIKNCLSEKGRLILSFPTPPHLAWLRANQPDQIQPIDNDVSALHVAEMAEELRTALLLYREVDVWRTADYAHAVLARRQKWPDSVPSSRPVQEAPNRRSGTRFSYRRLLDGRGDGAPGARAQRLARVHRYLDPTFDLNAK